MSGDAITEAILARRHRFRAAVRSDTCTVTAKMRMPNAVTPANQMPPVLPEGPLSREIVVLGTEQRAQKVRNEVSEIK